MSGNIKLYKPYIYTLRRDKMGYLRLVIKNKKLGNYFKDGDKFELSIEDDKIILTKVKPKS